MNANATKTELVAAYLTAVEAKIAQYPKCAWQRAEARAWAERAELGRVTRRVRTKGRMTDVGAGGLVLVGETREAIPGVRGPMAEIWSATGSRGDTRTLVDPKTVERVEPACGTCGGSGRVSHKRGFVVFDCPTCAR